MSLYSTCKELILNQFSSGVSCIHIASADFSLWHLPLLMFPHIPVLVSLDVKDVVIRGGEGGSNVGEVVEGGGEEIAGVLEDIGIEVSDGGKVVKTEGAEGLDNISPPTETVHVVYACNYSQYCCPFPRSIFMCRNVIT